MPARRPARRTVRRTAALLTVALGLITLTAGFAASPADAAGTLTGPGALSVTTTPSDLSAVRAGDRVHIVFRGLDTTQYIDFVGNCPSPLPVPLATLTTGSQLGLACAAQFDSGLQGAIDATTGQNLAVSAPPRAPLYPAKDGTVTLDYLVGSGASLGRVAYYLFLADPLKPPVIVNTLTCGPDNPCTIGFAVKSLRPGSPLVSWADLTSLVIRPAPLAADSSGCRPTDDLTVNAAGPERGQILLAALNRGSCRGAPSSLPVNYVPSDETAAAKVGSGTDLAIAGGPLLSAPDAPKPAAERVLVPLGLSAAVLAEVGGPAKGASLVPGQTAFSGDPLPPLALTASDAARIVLHDYPAVDTYAGLAARANSLAPALQSRPGNAAALNGFDPNGFGLPLNAAPTVAYPSGPSSSANAVSSYLSVAAAGSWRYPDQPPNATAKRVGRSVGVTSSFDPLIDPGALLSNTGRPVLTSVASTSGYLYSVIFGKDIGTAASLLPCPAFPAADSPISLVLAKGCLRFVVGDGATLSSLRLPTAQIQNSALSYVAPSVAGLQAAAAGAVPDASGALLLSAARADAYPMTFVEYAVVPAAPLLTKACLPRTGQQDRLRAFLTYATGAGQAVLPAGMAPLPAELKAATAAAIAKVGTGVVTGPCAKAPTAAGGSAGAQPDGAPGTPGANVPVGIGTPGLRTGAFAQNSLVAQEPVGAQPPTGPTLALAAATLDAAVPRFNASLAGSGLLPLLGLALLVGAMSAGGLGAAGRTPPWRGVAARLAGVVRVGRRAG